MSKGAKILVLCIIAFMVLQTVIYKMTHTSAQEGAGHQQEAEAAARNQSEPEQQAVTIASRSSDSSEVVVDHLIRTKKYLISVHVSGMNNYIRALADTAYMLTLMNDTSITLLIHPNIQNAHSNSRAFTLKDRGRIRFGEMNNQNVLFSELFQIPTSSFHTVVHRNDGTAATIVTKDFRLNYEIATPGLLRALKKATSSKNRSSKFKIGHCRTSKLQTESLQAEQKSKRLMECMTEHFRTNTKLVALHQLWIKNVGLENVPDFQPSLYEMIMSTFHTQNNIDITESAIMIHLRLGDFQNFCKYRGEDCWFEMAEVEPHILQLQHTTGAKHVIIMTNPIPKDERESDPTCAVVRKHPDWFLSMDIIEQSEAIPLRMKQDINAVLVLEMTAAISSKYFVGNAFSTIARTIAHLRKRQNKSQESAISFPTLVGKTGCSNCADLLV